MYYSAILALGRVVPTWSLAFPEPRPIKPVIILKGTDSAVAKTSTEMDDRSLIADPHFWTSGRK
jgi:hypothetical protein